MSISERILRFLLGEDDDLTPEQAKEWEEKGGRARFRRFDGAGNPIAEPEDTEESKGDRE
jgi:hypothetical protein